MRRPGKFANRSRVGKLRGDRRETREKSTPGGSAFRQFQLFRKILCYDDPRAGHTVVEAQHPHPSAIKDVMHGGVIQRVRRRARNFVIRHLVTAMDADEVRIERLCSRKIIKTPFGKTERATQESARAAGVYDHPRS